MIPLSRRRSLTGGEQRDQSTCALNELQVGDHISNFFKIGAIEQRFAFHHDQNVELSRWKSLGDRFVLPIFLGVGAE